jgi:hypothetical protein
MRPARKAEPRFDIDVAYGGQGELQIGEMLDWIAAGNGRVEVKRKRVLDLWFYIETRHDPGRRGEYVPSGMSVTTAPAWAFVIGDLGLSVIFPTDLIREMLDDPSTKDREERDGSCPTKGRLISLAVLLFRYTQRAGTPGTRGPDRGTREPGAREPAPSAPDDRAPVLATDIRWSV